MAELVFFSGTMDCGKSTLALQMEHNHRQRGRQGLIFTKLDRAGTATLSSRLGLSTDAIEVTDATDFWDAVADVRIGGGRVDYVICDEAQFFSPAQAEQLARVVDELGVDVFAFGITADFRTRLFPGSQRLIELADRVQVLQVEALCWCGARATHNARTVNGVMVVEGEQVVVGDTDAGDAVGYEVLCRRHHMRRMTAVSQDALVRATALEADALPFDTLELAACALPPRRTDRGRTADRRTRPARRTRRAAPAAAARRPVGARRAARRTAYLAGHLPGAVWVDLDADLAGPPGRGGRHPLPSPAAAQAALRRLGVRQDRGVVGYDDADGSVAARVPGGCCGGSGTPTSGCSTAGCGPGRRPDCRWRAATCGRSRATSLSAPGAMPVVDADGAAALAHRRAARRAGRRAVPGRGRAGRPAASGGDGRCLTVVSRACAGRT